MSKNLLASFKPRPSTSRYPYLWWGIVAVLAIVLPLVQPPFIVSLATLALAYTIAISGLGLLTGIAGQVSLAQSAFVAAGAYTVAILMERFNWPFLLAIVAAAAVAFVLGLIVGLPAGRLQGHYLAVITFMVALIVPPVLLRLKDWTGGANGMVVSAPMVPDFGLAADQWKFYIALVVAALVLLLVANIRRSNLGRSLVLMYTNPLVAVSFGVNATRLKVVTFAWSGMCGGLAGAMMTMIDEFAAPQTFTFMLAILLLVGGVVGGLGTAAGAILGGILLVVLPLVTSGAGLGWVGVIYGALVLAIVLVAPKGLVGLGQDAVRLVTRLVSRGRRSGTTGAAAPARGRVEGGDAS